MYKIFKTFFFISRCRTCLTTDRNKRYINVEEHCIDDTTIENVLSIIIPYLVSKFNNYIVI